MIVRVTHHNPSGPALRRTAARIKPESAKSVNKAINQGQRKAAANSRRTSGAHAPHHPDSITAEMTGPLQGEWGPDVALPQGNLDLEFGTGRQTAPHLAVTKSGLAQVPLWHRDVSRMVDSWVK